MGRPGFIAKVLAETAKHSFKKQDNNIDYRRFGSENIPSVPLKESFSSLISVLKNNKNFNFTYNLLADEYSKELYIRLIIFRILGSRRVKLPVNNKDFWEKYKTIDEKYLEEKNTFSLGNFNLNKYRIKEDSIPFTFNGHSLSVLNTFLLQQYVYSRNGSFIGASEGDTVIEAGACWGDTSLFFAGKAGNSGKVYAFEFEENNIKVLNDNLNLNPGISRNIELVRNAVWYRSGEVFTFTKGGPGTTIANQSGGGKFSVVSISIDDFVKERNLASVDFIKMDIEGAELNALKGAAETIKTFRPKLAISLYHKFRDFYLIPIYLKELSDKYNLGYKFYLDHFTIYSEETVLFAAPVSE